jgi:hypothetical protein
VARTIGKVALAGHDGESLGFTGSGPLRRVEALLAPPADGASSAVAIATAALALAATAAAVAGFAQLLTAWLPAA